jgi:hypothetical protein
LNGDRMKYHCAIETRERKFSFGEKYAQHSTKRKQMLATRDFMTIEESSRGDCAQSLGKIGCWMDANQPIARGPEELAQREQLVQIAEQKTIPEDV